MNNFMLDIRALGKAPDSPIFAIECVFFDQRGRLDRNTIEQSTLELWVALILRLFSNS